MAFLINFLNPPQQTDSHPCIRLGGPVDCIGGPVDQAMAMSWSSPDQDMDGIDYEKRKRRNKKRGGTNNNL